MKSTNNFIFITLEKEFEDEIVGPEGKLKLRLHSFKDNIVDEKDEVIYNSNEKRINYGTVIAIPDKLNDEVKIHQEDPGKPEPERYIGHEHVIQAPQFLTYEPGTYVAKWRTTADIVPEVEVGDKVYFHFNTIAPENSVTLPDGTVFYKLAYQNVLCVVREGEIIPIGSNVFIEPEYEDGVIDLGTDGTKAKISPSGIITEVGVRPKALRGYVRHIGAALRGHVREVNPGDKIVYSKNSDWPVKVEGKTYFCMKQWDIEGIIPE